MERVFAKFFARFYEKKNNTWNIRPLVDKSFVPSAQQTSVLYCRLTDFSTGSLKSNDRSQKIFLF